MHGIRRVFIVNMLLYFLCEERNVAILLIMERVPTPVERLTIGVKEGLWFVGLNSIVQRQVSQYTLSYRVVLLLQSYFKSIVPNDVG